jgi:hypothetical protein
MIGLEPVTVFLEVRPKFGVIIDFAVEDERQLTINRRHWLIPVSQINNREPTMAEENLAAMPKTAAVRSTMDHDIGHSLQDLEIA